MENEKITLKGSYNFSEISYKTLKKILELSIVRDKSIFNEWFDFEFEIPDYDIDFLEKLIKANEYNTKHYSEYQLSLYFISPFLSKIYFFNEKYRDWYQYELSGIVNGYKLSGITDFMVATGVEEPEKPYFFIQEFKKSIPKSKHPLGQLLSEMAVALEINEKNIIRGAYNIGQHWNFIILKKTPDKKYKYYESKSFDSLDIEHLKKIYKYLQAVKHKYCK